MERFREILVYPASLDNEDPAIDTAAELARKTGARLTLLSIVDWSPRTWARAQAGLANEAKLRASSFRLTQALMDDGILASDVIVRSDDPAQAITSVASESNSDLLIKTAQGEPEPRRLFSNVAERLMQQLDCPVWLVRGATSDGAKRVLAAVGPFGEEHAAQSLDREVLDVASQLARVRGAELHVVCAWWPLGIAGAPFRQRPEQDAFEQACEHDAQHELRRFLLRSAVHVDQVHVRRGSPAPVIANVADEIGALLIVVGSGGRAGWRRVLVGNTADGVLEHSDRGMLAIREPTPASVGE